MPSAAETIAAYVSRTRFEDLPPEAVAGSVVCVQDLLGVALAGATTPLGPTRQSGRDARCERGGNVVGHGAPRLARDDGAGQRHGSPRARLGRRPRLLPHRRGCDPSRAAEAEARGASPREFLTAICVGYDVTTRVSDGIDPDRLYRKGYHPTAVCGVFGAAAAVGRLMRLDAARLTNAIGIAGSFSAGNLEFLSDGAMTKRLQAGKAAADGVRAAQLAAQGFTGPRTILEGPYGVWRYTESRQTERFAADLGTRYAIREVHFKKHACCLSMAAAMDGALDLLREERLRVADIAAIRVGLCPAGTTWTRRPRW